MRRPTTGLWHLLDLSMGLVSHALIVCEKAHIMKWTAVAAIVAVLVPAAVAAEPPMAGTGVGGSPCSVFNQINASDPDWAKSHYLS